jgi:hypothetical protein
MANIFRLYISVLRSNWYAKILLGCLHAQGLLLWSAGIWILQAPKLQAATENSVFPKTADNRNLPSELSRQISSAGTPENLTPELVSSFKGSSVAATATATVAIATAQSTTYCNRTCNSCCQIGKSHNRFS